MLEAINDYLINHGLTDGHARLFSLSLGLTSVFLLTIIVYWLCRRILVPILEKIARRSSLVWDDSFITNNFFKRLAPLPSCIILYEAAEVIFRDAALLNLFIKRGALILLVIVGIRLVDAALRSLQDIYNHHAKLAADWPVKGYLDALRIILYILAVIFVISIFTGKSPWGIISVLGGLTAVLLLIFKDTILGFVANLQLTANDMIKVGDWIQMPKRGADGDVIDISLHTVKVQNWDKTITTIPTYHLVNEDFINWRGMTQSGGRRIKRALLIDMTSISFVTEEMLARFRKYILLEDYLQKKEEEILEFNRTHHPDPEKFGGRRQTNVGIFRAYIKSYLRNNPHINQDLTFMVRQLAPTPQGLPIEVYVFSADQRWVYYEGIQADIFDHLLAIAPEFGLRIFQYPSGYDLRQAMAGSRE